MIKYIKYMPINRKAPFLLEVARGRIEGHSVVNKFGRNPSIDTASGFEAVWNGGGDYTGHDPTAAEIVEIFSSDDNDGAGANTGALTLEVFGLDADYVEQNEIVTLNGQTPAETTKSYIRLNRMIVRTAGATGSNEGTLTCRQKTTTANIFSVMPIGYNQTMIACYTIPVNKKGYMLSWFGSLARKKDGFSNLRLIIKPFGEVFQVKEEFTIGASGSSYVLRDFHAPKDFMDEKTDIKIMADSSVNDLGVAAGFDLLLIQQS